MIKLLHALQLSTDFINARRIAIAVGINSNLQHLGTRSTITPALRNHQNLKTPMTQSKKQWQVLFLMVE
jgi:hypothetical protein